MKKFKFVFILFAFVTSGLALSSCGGSNSANSEPQGKEYTSAYICPMHCEGSGSAEAGTCPVCGMDYVQNESHNASKHEH